MTAHLPIRLVITVVFEMSSVAILPNQFNAAKLTAKPIKELPSKAKAVNLDYADRGGSWMIQTPVTQLPYGMNVFDKDGKNPKYSIDLSFRGSDDDAKVKAFYEFAQAFDERMIQLAMENAQSWFKLSNPSREIINAFYTPMVKIPRDKEGKVKPYPPTCKIALKQKDGVFSTEFYDPEKKRYEGMPVEELLVARTKVRCIIRCNGLWIAGSKFGPMWKAEQICIDSMPERLRGYGFLDDEPRSKASAPAPAPAPAAPTNRFSNLAQDEEEEADKDEDEDDGDEVVEPVPVPSAPKKLPPSAQPKKTQPKKAGGK